MAEEEKKSNEKKPADGPYSFLRIALSGIAVFAALSYVLGRFRIEAYYKALGIAPGLLSFGPEDYMFSSINLVIICVMVSYFLYVYYSSTVRGARMFLAFPLYPDPKNRQERITDISMIIACIVLTVTILVNFYSEKESGFFAPGLIGVAVGGAVGISIVLYIWLLRWFLGAKKANPILFLGVLLLIIWLPSISGTLAKIEAKTDMQTFPRVVLICEDALNPQLQSSPQSANKSVEVRIITTNNDMTYVLKQDVDLADEWQVYGIQNHNIETIIFAEKSG